MLYLRLAWISSEHFPLAVKWAEKCPHLWAVADAEAGERYDSHD
jgi:hypothetical protein